MKLIQLTNNFFDWNSRISEILILIRADSQDEALILKYCEIAEALLLQYTNIAIIENTYLVENDCGDCEENKFVSPILPVIDNENCDDCIGYNVEFQAGKEPDEALFWALVQSIEALYNHCGSPADSFKKYNPNIVYNVCEDC